MARKRDRRVPRRERREALPPRSTPLPVEGGIKAQSQAGDFGESWWAGRWQAVLESFRVGGRLARGRTYARQGQVLHIDIRPGKVTALVQGSRPQPYKVAISVKELTLEQWQRVADKLAQSALFVAKLLAGEMPRDIEKAFEQAELSLFPERGGDLRTSCNCPDEANPCKHIAAVYYLLGEEFDRDPFLLFRLRGLERDQLVSLLGATRGERPNPTDPEVVRREPLPTEARAFWTLGPLAEDFYGEVETPPLTAALVRRLGKFPFWRSEQPLVEAVEPAYVAVSALGLKTLLGERGDE
ncbi:MAG: SWIM zinc finger family protein [Gemmataceae bacterium]